MKVLVIPENPTLDQHILKPVVVQIFKELNRKARIEVLQDPHLSGVEEALDSTILGEILRDNRMIDLFLLMVDRDGIERREQAVQQRVADAAAYGRTMIGCLAIEELEVWALALHKREINDDWHTKVRRELNPKEIYFEPFVRQKKWLASVGNGRVPAMRDLRRRWDSLKSLCPEVQVLVDQVREWLAGG